MEPIYTCTTDGKKELEEKNYNLMAQANDMFNNGLYHQSLILLDEVEQTSGCNSKIRHNRAVVEFYKSDCKEHTTLMRTLIELLKEEQSVESDELVGITNPIARYNLSVVFYHKRMYRMSMETLAPLVEKIETLEEHTASVGILLLRLLLATNKLNKALSFLERLQHYLGQNVNDALTVEDKGEEDAHDKFQLRRTFKLLGLLTYVLNRRIVVVTDDGSPEFSALKAHQYYIMKDFQMAAKQLKKISDENVTTGSDAEINTCIANNMGVIHMRVRHYAIAAKFFQNAINFDKQISSNLRNAPLYQLSAASSCEILYNLGISMLHLRRPKEAFQCFLVPLKSYHSNPRLWFRIAEACIMTHEMKVIEDDRKPIVSSIAVGTRKEYILKSYSRGIYTPSTQSAAVPEPNMEFAALSLRNALTLTNAIRTNFYKIPTKNNEASGVIEGESEPQNWKKVRDNNFCNPSTPITKEALDSMLSAIFAAYSYVSLRLGDYVTALEMAQELKKSDKLSDAHKLLAHMYTGEALLMMDKIQEAKPHLDPGFVSTLNTFDFETKDWQVKSLDAAQNIVRYNLAVAMTLQGDYEGAIALLKKCNHPIVANKMMTLQVSLEIRTGK